MARLTTTVYATAEGEPVAFTATVRPGFAGLTEPAIHVQVESEANEWSVTLFLSRANAARLVDAIEEALLIPAPDKEATI
jgi:hypothetical protein